MVHSGKKTTKKHKSIYFSLSDIKSDCIVPVLGQLGLLKFAKSQIRSQLLKNFFNVLSSEAHKILALFLIGLI